MSSNRAIRVFGFHSAAIKDDELHHFGEFSKTVPCREAADVVLSDEIEQLSVRLALAERLDCVDGIGRRRTLEFHRIESKTRLAFDRSAQHFQTDIGCRELLIQLVGRSGGLNKDNFFEIERFECVARQNQVSVMDRIEGATEDADLFQAKRLFCTATALCRVSNIVLIQFRLCRGADQERPDRNGQAFFVSGGKHEI
jgi:hypothetical protein